MNVPIGTMTEQAPTDEQLEKIASRMGTPSEVILRVLVAAGGEALPGFEITRRVTALLDATGLPRRSLDASTLHYALLRMMQDGLVVSLGEREVEVPAPHGKTYRQNREVYAVGGLRAGALVRYLDFRANRLARAFREAPNPKPAAEAI